MEQISNVKELSLHGWSDALPKFIPSDSEVQNFHSLSMNLNDEKEKEKKDEEMAFCYLSTRILLSSLHVSFSVLEYLINFFIHDSIVMILY